MKHGRATILGALVFPLLCGAAGQAQKAPYTIHETVRRVVVDVVVTGKDGHDVHGLKQQDFEVFENNRRQTIRSFEEVRFRKTEAAKAPQLPAETYTDIPRHPGGGPLYVIVYDMADMGFCHTNDCDLTDQEWARKQLAKFLAKTPPGSQFALFLVAREVRLIQGFTTDRQKLLDLFDVHRRDQHVPWVFLYQDNFPSRPWQALAYLGRWLEGLPGRKNVIWLASGFPVDLAQWKSPAATSETLSPSGWFRPAPGENSRASREAIDLIDNAQIALYPVDVGGVGPADVNARESAKVTGGHAYESNRPGQDMAQATENGDSYYEISYAPTAQRYDRTVRNIRVKLLRRGYQLEYRHYYFADRPNVPLTWREKHNAKMTADELAAHRLGEAMYAYMHHGAPAAHEILFRAHVHAGAEAMATRAQMQRLADEPAFFVRGRRGRREKLTPVPLRRYTIRYAVQEPRTAPAGGAAEGPDVLEFAVCAYKLRGVLLNERSQQTEGPAEGTAVLRASQTLEVPATAAWLRMGVRDVTSGRMGTIEIRLPQAGAAKAAAGRS